jgi:hypothetical protein
MKQKTNFNGSKPWVLVFAFCLLLGLVGCAQSPVSKTISATETGSFEPKGPVAEWRAINRLTYGPTPSLLAELKSNAQPKEWALNQLDAARKASLEAPKLPSDLASINDSLPLI